MELEHNLEELGTPNATPPPPPPLMPCGCNVPEVRMRIIRQRIGAAIDPSTPIADVRELAHGNGLTSGELLDVIKHIQDGHQPDLDAPRPPRSDADIILDASGS